MGVADSANALIEGSLFDAGPVNPATQISCPNLKQEDLQ
jgi:hypothetical protein